LLSQRFAAGSVLNREVIPTQEIWYKARVQKRGIGQKNLFVFQ